MTEKKFLDVRISVSQEITNWTYEEIERRLNSAFSFIAFKVTPLPELASEVNKILSKYYACDNINCGKGAICNYCAIRKDLEALLGKVALPSPMYEKDVFRFKKSVENGEDNVWLGFRNGCINLNHIADKSPGIVGMNLRKAITEYCSSPLPSPEPEKKGGGS